MLTLNYIFPGGSVITINPELFGSFGAAWAEVQAEYFTEAIFFYTMADPTTDIWENESFELTRGHLAQLLAAHTSGVRDAKPEEDDFDLADVLLKIVEKELQHG